MKPSDRAVASWVFVILLGKVDSYSLKVTVRA
jgi:hypothetical protein